MKTNLEDGNKVLNDINMKISDIEMIILRVRLHGLDEESIKAEGCNPEDYYKALDMIQKHLNALKEERKTLS